MASYVIAPDGSSIMCGRCGSISYQPQDVEMHYCGECHRFHDDVQMITFLVIYKHPSDYPNDFVLRKCATLLVPGKSAFEVTDKACQVGPYAELRARVPKQATRVGPMPGDDPVIYEVWML